MYLTWSKLDFRPSGNFLLDRPRIVTALVVATDGGLALNTSFSAHAAQIPDSRWSLRGFGKKAQAEGSGPTVSAPEAFLLDRLRSGIVLLDCDLRALWINRYAQSVFASYRGIELRDRVCLRDELDDERLLRLLRAAAAGSSGAIIVRSRGDPPITLLAFRFVMNGPPNGVNFSSISESPRRASLDCVALILGTRATADPGAISTFASLYCLTAAETRVLAALLEDGPPAQIAASIGVGIRTIRTQLSSIYSKVGVDSQRELVALLLSFPPFTVC